MRKKIFLTIGGLFIILLAYGAFSLTRLADIRTPEVKAQFDREKGITILNQMAAAHGIQHWDSIHSYSLTISKNYLSTLAQMMNVYPENKITFHFDVIPGTFTSRLTIASGEWKDQIWGIQSWHTYKGSRATKPIFHVENDSDIEFGLPTYQYFIEVPKRILEADIISYAGERSLKGNTYDLVYATWGAAAPQKDVDQYILWVDRKTKRLRYLHYTVRDKMPSAQASRKYDTYIEKGNVLFPQKMTSVLKGPENDNIAQTIEISDIVLDKIPPLALMPDPDLGTRGKH
ncbi:hypothetical protein [Spongiimicrobium salis]|uniref:hypothetical protein n=1 Tax=Spongiimicrobium salis TaxID=1667022 RepID=UPI00374CE048